MSDEISSPEIIKIYGLPHGVVLWPTAFTAVLFGFIGLLFEVLESTVAVIFMVVYGVNLLILFFDFSRGVVVGIFGLIVALLSLMYAFDFSIAFNKTINTGIIQGASPQFLIIFGATFLILLWIAILFRKRFEYFEVSSNEIVRKMGVLGDADRFAAPDVTIRKEIVDVFESLILFGAGNLRIITAKGREFNIQNVPRINKVERDFRRILGRLAVKETMDEPVEKAAPKETPEDTE